MKIAYLMLVHSNPRLLQRAIQTLSSPDSAFFIHIDRKANIGEFSHVRGRDAFLTVPRIPVYWGEFSQVEATILLMQKALVSCVKFDYFVFLQGSDYPIRSGSYIQSFLETNRLSEFIGMVRMPAPGYPLSKINKVRFSSDKPFRRFASRVFAKIDVAQRDYKKSLGRLEPYAGDACWTLSRDACQYVVDFVQCNPWFRKYFQRTFTSDEMFFHRILGNSQFRSRINTVCSTGIGPVLGDSSCHS